MLTTPLWNDSHGPVLQCQEHIDLLEPSNTGWEKLCLFSKDSGRKLKRSTHWIFPCAILFRVYGMLYGALAWGHTVGSGPAIALRMTVTFSVTPENVGFSHLPWGSAKAIMQQPPSWQVGKYIKDLWLPTLGRIKWQTFVFKGHGHLNFKRKLSF